MTALLLRRNLEVKVKPALDGDQQYTSTTDPENANARSAMAMCLIDVQYMKNRMRFKM